MSFLSPGGLVHSASIDQAIDAEHQMIQAWHLMSPLVGALALWPVSISASTEAAGIFSLCELLATAMAQAINDDDRFLHRRQVESTKLVATSGQDIVV